MDCEQALYFLFPSSCASRSCRAPREISRSPRLAHKAPVMQAKSDFVVGKSLSVESCLATKKCMTSLQTPSDISRSSQSIKIGIDLSINKWIKIGKSDLYRSIGRNRWHARFVHRFILIFTDFIDLYPKIHLFIKKWKLDSCKQYVCWQLSCNWESKDKTIYIITSKNLIFSSKPGLKIIFFWWLILARFVDTQFITI